MTNENTAYKLYFCISEPDWSNVEVCANLQSPAVVCCNKSTILPSTAQYTGMSLSCVLLPCSTTTTSVVLTPTVDSIGTGGMSENIAQVLLFKLLSHLYLIHSCSKENINVLKYKYFVNIQEQLQILHPTKYINTSTSSN